MTDGFVTRAEATGKLPTRAALRAAESRVRPEYWQRLGLKGVEHLAKGAKHPNIQPSGAKHPDIYVLGEAPGANEDEEGEPFVGKSGQKLRAQLQDVRVRYDNVCRTRPPDNRPPTEAEIECFRPMVRASIEKAKPPILLAVGRHALDWAQPGISAKITTSRGRWFPTRIGSHTCWVVPVLHPAFILRIENSRKARFEEVPGEEWAKVWERDLEMVCKGRQDPPKVQDPAHADLGVQLLTDPADIFGALKEWRGKRSLAIDLETSTKRPYAKGAKLLTVALSDGRATLAFPVDHPGAEAGPRRGRLLGALAAVLEGTHLLAHNAIFEAEWLAWALGPQVLLRPKAWHCSKVQAFVLDEREGALDLDYVCRLHLGLPLKSLSPDINTNRLESTPVDQVLRYNALDAKYTHRLHVRQWSLIESQGLLPIYGRHMDRVLPFALAQRVGLPVNVKTVKTFGKVYAEKMQEAESAARALPSIRRFEKKHGRLRISVPDSVAEALEFATGEQVGSTAKGILEELAKTEPFAARVLEYRRVQKLKSTYIDRMLPGARRSYIYPDGRIHCLFVPAGPESGRSASRDPNGQNWPKRRDKEVRRVVDPGPGWSLLSSDYKQLEALCIACVSEDPTFCRAILSNYDVHMDWAQRILKAYPKAIKNYGDVKAFRSVVKNQWVFPQFYGASFRTCARALGIPEDIAERLAGIFWSKEHFAGVRNWQRRLLRQYEQKGYVQSVTGRRHRAPLSYNQVINLPIQGPAADIVCYAMYRLSMRALTKGPEWLQPVLNIHDDLTFIVPTDKVEWASRVISKTMTAPPWPWVFLPLTVEMESGPTWADMKTIGTYTGPGIAREGA